MKKIILLSIFILSCKLFYSQQAIGLVRDINGASLNGYLDPIIYAPPKKIHKIHDTYSSEKGYYYNKNGERTEGLLKFERGKIFIKKDLMMEKVKSKNIRGFVIGVDSFFVLNKSNYKKPIRGKQEYAKRIANFNGYTFAKHYSFPSALEQQFGSPSIEEIYIVKHKDSTHWQKFLHVNSFKKCALHYFGHISDIKNKINSEELTENHLMSIIRKAEYFEKYTNSEKIYFDKYWQETSKQELAHYYAKITGKSDSIWTVEYHNDKNKIYEAQYSSFYPHIKNGSFTAFFPNRKTRMTIVFENDKPLEKKIYFKNGLLKSHAFITHKDDKKTSGKAFTSTQEDDTPNMLQYEKFVVINDSLGNNQLPEKGISKIDFYDEITKLTYTNVFENGKLILTYRLLNKDTVFQITEPTYNFKINSLQRKFKYFLADHTYDKTLNENAQGTVLVSLLIDEKGYVQKCTVLNKLHPEFNQLVEWFISGNLLSGANPRYKFKPYKKDKEKRFCEFMIPISFSINRFYRNARHSSPFNFWLWPNYPYNPVYDFKPASMQNMPKLPTMPRGF